MNPEDPLYIYELEGTITEPEKYFQKNLLAHWREGESTFLFFSQPSTEKLKQFLKAHSEVSWVRTHEISYRDWQAGETLAPIKIGRLGIIPLGHPVPRDEDLVSIIIDPGVVFGSGQHPTTRDSLKALLWIYDRDKPESVLDLGTGTGILAIAAAKLGAREVLGIDWNPACVANTRKNIELNGLSGRIRVEEGLAEEYLKQKADLLFANLHFAVVRELVEQPAFFEKRWAVLSGLLRSEYAEIKRRLERPGFSLLGEWETDNTWFTLLGQNLGRVE
jgi:ribosomal protein L11 methyltransferase